MEPANFFERVFAERAARLREQAARLREELERRERSQHVDGRSDQG